MDYCIITTYNRPREVENLVSQVRQVFAGKIIVFDDASEEKPSLSGCEVIRYSKNHGKKNYYQLVTDIFQLLHPKRNKVDKFWILPDDITISENLFTESVRLWDAIRDERKICLSVGHTHNRHYNPCWNHFKPVRMGEVVQSNWNDMCFMAEGNFLEQLNYEIEKPLSSYDYRSSGVGRHISRTLFNKGWNLYHTNTSLCEFLNVPTQMHRQNIAG